PFASSARPRKYLSPSGTDPNCLSARRFWMYVSTSGEYCRSSSTSACSCRTTLSTTSPTVVGCWALATMDIALSTTIAGRILRARMEPPHLDLLERAIARLVGGTDTASCTKGQFRVSGLVAISSFGFSPPLGAFPEARVDNEN